MSFSAAYAGRCGNCNEPFIPGDVVSFDGPDDTLIALRCCGDDQAEWAARDSEKAATMPRGKTAADRCDKCFLVPASNGVCGCS